MKNNGWIVRINSNLNAHYYVDGESKCGNYLISDSFLYRLSYIGINFDVKRKCERCLSKLGAEYMEKQLALTKE